MTKSTVLLIWLCFELLAEEGRGGLDEFGFDLRRDGGLFFAVDGGDAAGDIAFGDDGHETSDGSAALDDADRFAVRGKIELAVLDDAVNLGRELAVGVIALRHARGGDDGVPVADHDGEAAGLREGLGILSGELCELTNGGIFLEDDFALAIRVDFKGVALADTHGSADLLRDHDAAEVIDPSHNTGSFHGVLLCSVIIWLSGVIVAPLPRFMRWKVREFFPWGDLVLSGERCGMSDRFLGGILGGLVEVGVKNNVALQYQVVLFFDEEIALLTNTASYAHSESHFFKESIRMFRIKDLVRPHHGYKILCF